MSNLFIYLAGKMTGLEYDEMQDWRFKFEDKVMGYAKNSDISYKVNIFNPCDYYNPVTDFHNSELEPMEFDLHYLKKSNLMVVNLETCDSIGTAMEIAIARDNRIPIVAYCPDNSVLHPWVENSCLRIIDNWDDLYEYVCDYFVFPLMV